MAKIGVFFGSSTGTTADVATRIANKLGVAGSDVHDVANVAPSGVAPYDILLLGSSTWGNGELQDDWENYIAGLEALDLKGKTIAVFGCGDESMSDTFCNAVGIIYGRLQKTGARFVGAYPAECYNYSATAAEKDGVIVGLLLDEVNHPDLTDERIDGWVKEIK